MLRGREKQQSNLNIRLLSVSVRISYLIHSIFDGVLGMWDNVKNLSNLKAMSSASRSWSIDLRVDLEVSTLRIALASPGAEINDFLVWVCFLSVYFFEEIGAAITKLKLFEYYIAFCSVRISYLYICGMSLACGPPWWTFLTSRPCPVEVGGGST